MTESQTPYLPDDEPTAAPLMREIIAEFRDRSEMWAERGDIVMHSRVHTKMVALIDCMRAAGWRTDELEES